MGKYFVLILMLIFTMSFTACATPEWLANWQKKQVNKRYGPDSEQSSDQVEDWEEQVLVYEKEINKKIKAADNAARLHRKIGETYAKVGMYEKCITELEQAIVLGYTDPEVFFTLGLCQGNLAKMHNWEKQKSIQAEQTFLKVLNLNSNFHKAKFQLGIIYFYAFGMQSRFSIEYGDNHIERSRFRKKAIDLIVEYQRKVPDDAQSYFALGGIYNFLNMPNQASNQYSSLIHQLQKNYGSDVEKKPEYKQAISNLNKISENLRKKKEKSVIITPEP
ncbi:MAG: hypothetical protein ABUK01_02220 [Leptospirales bacterium]